MLCLCWYVELGSSRTQSPRWWMLLSKVATSSIFRLNFNQFNFFCHSTIVHEFVHALGAFHVHSRDDRDNYVSVDFSNIQAGKEHNFKKHANAPTFGAPYDPLSLMHYEHWAFGIDKSKPTISSKVIVTFNPICFQIRSQFFTQ